MFSDYVHVAYATPKLLDKFELAANLHFIDHSETWILADEDGVYSLCDFITPGGFPGFVKKEDAETCKELLADQCNFFIQKSQREGVEYWLLD